MIWSLGVRDVVVETLQMDNLPELASIHRECFARGWMDCEFVHLLDSADVRGLQAYRPATFFVPQSPGPRGFVLTRIAAQEAEILTIAVAACARRFGIGRALMTAVLDELYAERVSSLFLEVDETNRPAIRLYQSLGFHQVGKREAYYAHKNSEKDQLVLNRALVMRCDVG